jgi:hypothetical protein
VPHDGYSSCVLFSYLRERISLVHCHQAFSTLGGEAMPMPHIAASTHNGVQGEGDNRGSCMREISPAACVAVCKRCYAK